MGQTLRRMLYQYLRRHFARADVKSVMDIWDSIAREQRLMSPTQEAEDEEEDDEDDDEDKDVEDMGTDYGEDTDESDGENESDDSDE